MNSFNAHSALSADFLAKLPLYKTAYSPIDRQYVGIVSVDMESEVPVVKAFLSTDPGTIVSFLVTDLTKYCL